MRISYINGVCVKNDAISNSICDEIGWLRTSGHDDLRLYGYACDYDELPFSRVAQISDIAYDHHFQTSDLIIFHYGIHYPLFDLLPVCPKQAKKIVVFHNITPREFVASEQHEVIDKSIVQISNMQFADHVVCDSEVNLDVLKQANISVPSSVLPLASTIEAKAKIGKPSSRDGLVRMSFIGRFVESKGVIELLEALESALQRDPQLHLQLDMVGNLDFSDPNVVQQVKKRQATMLKCYPERVDIGLHGNASNEVKKTILENADLFVLPTYHEGFCVPILEAMASGCMVIAYNNSNVPWITGGLAKLVDSGDVHALSISISENAAKILDPAWHGTPHSGYESYIALASEHLEHFSIENCASRFLEFIRGHIPDKEFGSVTSHE